MLPAIRRSALFVLLGVAPLVAAYACGDFSGDAAAPGVDAGSEGATVTDAPFESSTDAADGALAPSCVARAIATGIVHSCAVFGPTGRVACWGDNAYGESGGDLDAGVAMRTSAGIVAGLDHVKQLALGLAHSCALKEDGTVWCWGASAFGQLGTGATDGVSSAQPAQVYKLTDATHIAAGDYHTCARRADATVKCWGANTSGQLGDGTTTSQYSPVTAAVSGANEVATGAQHSCARLADGGVVCWGDNYRGQLGIGADDAGPDAAAPGYTHQSPQKVDLPEAVELSAGHYGTCAEFRAAPPLRCWGNNFLRVLVPSSNNQVIYQPTGVVIPFSIDGGDVAVGGFQTCAVADDGALFCWGDNSYGQIGTAAPSGPPSHVTTVGPVDHVATGFIHTCVIADASVSCFGFNEYGVLGQGTSDPPPPEGGLYPAHATPMRVVLPCP